MFPILFSVGNGETVQTVVVRTSDCFNCGMIEDVSQLDIKICGDKSCCFIQHLDNSDTNFRPGDEDRFDGASGVEWGLAMIWKLSSNKKKDGPYGFGCSRAPA